MPHICNQIFLGPLNVFGTMGLRYPNAKVQYWLSYSSDYSCSKTSARSSSIKPLHRIMCAGSNALHA